MARLISEHILAFFEISFISLIFTPPDLSIIFFAKYSCFSKNYFVWQYWFTLTTVPIIPFPLKHDYFRINGSLPALHFKNFPVVSYKLPEFKSRLLSHYLNVIRSTLGVTVSHFELVFLSFSYIFPYLSKKTGAKMVLMVLYRACRFRVIEHFLLQLNIFEVEHLLALLGPQGLLGGL